MAYAHICPVCGHKKITALPNNVTRCNTCTHYFQSDMKITIAYDKDYAEVYDKRPHEAMSRVRADYIERNIMLPKGGKILDVGYANGSFLKEMAKRGYDTYGSDLHGIDFGIREVQLTDPVHYSLITFFDCLEHFDDMALPLHLSADYFLITVPNTPPYFPAAATKWRHYKPGEHLHYFTYASMDRYMARFGKTRIAQGYPEDEIRGVLKTEGFDPHENIYTAIYA